MPASKFIYGGFFLCCLCLIYSKTEAKLSDKSRHHDENDNPENSAEAEKFIVFTPRGIRADDYTYLARAKRKFRVECQFNSDDIHSLHDLRWLTKQGHVIDGSSSASRFTVGLRKKGSHHVKKSLVFTNIAKRDEGVYICEAQLTGRTVRREIKIHVAEPISWNTEDSIISAKVGEDLTIDCGADADPEPSIYILDEQGRDMTEKYGHKVPEDSDEDESEHKITIQGITKLDQGRKIICSANQFFEDLQATDSEDHEISLDVWYAPEFEKPEISQYAIEDRSVLLWCNVSDANPPPTIYRFYRANTEIKDNRDYEISIADDNMYATLLIKNVQEDDFGLYRCEVGNMVKARSNLLVHLKVAEPPNAPHVELLDVSKHAIRWKISPGKKNGDHEIPTVKYIVQYKREDDTVNNNYPQRNEIPLKHSDQVIIHEIPGLIQGMEYNFQFMSENAAGISEAKNFTQSTLSDEVEENSSIRHSLIFTNLLLVVTLVFLSIK